MTDQDIFDLYVLQSENVRALAAAINGLIKDINFQIKKSDAFQVAIKTRMLALIYSAWSEAQFIQIIYTPNGFTLDELARVKDKKERFGIAEGWRLMLDLALEKVGDKNKSKDLRGRLETLLTLVGKYIEEPSIIRNKIAHGQWVRVLNRENTKENKELTEELTSLDPVVIGKMVTIHKYLGYIIRDLIQSPRASFHNHYWTNIVNLEEFERKTRNWNLDSKRTKLALKPITFTSKMGG